MAERRGDCRVLTMLKISAVVLLLVSVGTTYGRGHHIQWTSKSLRQQNAVNHYAHGKTSLHGPDMVAEMRKIKYKLAMEGNKMAMGHVSGHESRPCPCSNQSWCEVVRKTPEREIFVFSVNNHNWRKYVWDKITTIATFTYFDDELMCWAHSRGVKLVHGVDFPKKQLTNVTARHVWVSQVVSMMKLHFLDGVNVDFEESIGKKETPEREGLTLLMKELTHTAKTISPYTQITFDFPNHPNGCYGRYYDYKAISDIIDFAFIMDYDEYNGKYGGPNSAYDVTKKGMKQFIAGGIPGNKLVLGAPWYGFWFKCTTYKQTSHQCKWSKRQPINYGDIVKYLAISFTGRLWDDTSRSPFFAFKNPKDHVIYQLWYDDHVSLQYKFNLINSLGLRGAGNWQSDALNYSDPTEISDMWGAFP